MYACMHVCMFVRTCVCMCVCLHTLANKMRIMLMRIGTIRGSSSLLELIGHTLHSRAISLASHACSVRTSATTWTHLEHVDCPMRITLHFGGTSSHPGQVGGVSFPIDVCDNEGQLHVCMCVCMCVSSKSV
jgi:hypothetical protein